MAAMERRTQLLWPIVVRQHLCWTQLGLPQTYFDGETKMAHSTEGARAANQVAAAACGGVHSSSQAERKRLNSDS
jgi:hypothetical protein